MAWKYVEHCNIKDIDLSPGLLGVAPFPIMGEVSRGSRVSCSQEFFRRAAKIKPFIDKPFKVERTEGMAGFIYSQRQAEIYRFLERVGPCPLPALEILFGKKTHAALIALRRAGYIYDIVLNGIGFWVPQGYGHFDPKKQELMAWFVVRLQEKNGKYLGDGLCITPNGTQLRLQPQEGFILMVDDQNRKMTAYFEDLKLTTLNNCLKWNK